MQINPAEIQDKNLYRIKIDKWAVTRNEVNGRAKKISWNYNERHLGNIKQKIEMGKMS